MCFIKNDIMTSSGPNLFICPRPTKALGRPAHTKPSKNPLFDIAPIWVLTLCILNVLSNSRLKRFVVNTTKPADFFSLQIRTKVISFVQLARYKA